ncbi:MAG: O-antigen ligase family protein [Pseudomonadota bacterium]|nr:O-antigen ligase family protein [Pseudomonadota bacterium]
MLNLMLFASCYAGGFILAFSSNPVWAFMLYQVVYFMNPLDRWWNYALPSISYSFFTVVLMLAVFIKDQKNLSKNRIFGSPQFKWIYLILCSWLLTKTYAVQPIYNDEAVSNFLKLVVIISVAYKLIDGVKQLNMVLMANVAGAAYLGFVAFQTGRNSGGRVEGIGTVDSPDANGTAAAIVPSAVLALYFFWSSKRKTIKIVAVVFGAFIVNALVLINSRASFLALAASVFYFMGHLYFSSVKKDGQRRAVIWLGILGLIALTQVVDESALERFGTLKTVEMREDSETGATRLFFWLAALDMSVDHPFGAGARGFDFYSPEYIPWTVNTGGGRNRSVHSTWLESLTETGYHGFFFLVAMLISSFRATMKCKRKLSKETLFDEYYKIVAIEASLLAFIVAMTFMNRFRAEILYWCVLYTACAYNVFILKVPTEQKLSAIRDHKG